ncbi:DUF6443 domain-containing protein [Taibaiella koreensis]|uniref:DUF6443 domain-containing protein n=1 Tax=Taibaiella koreensis TaxID=1268548 RepID=UPI00196993A2|nr:DUF6443 domain-containing protein [Taibaiella koreensis]
MKSAINITRLVLLTLLTGPLAATAQQLSDPTTNIPQTPVSNSGPVTYPYLHDEPADRLYNAVTTQAPYVPVKSWPPPAEAYQQSKELVDGLGRPLQTVLRKAHATGADIVQPHVYDELGREQYQYLPYTRQPFLSDGIADHVAYYNLSNFYNGAGEPPYSRVETESSPLNRVLRKSAPGAGWVGAGRGIRHEYRFNEANEIRLWTIGNAATDLPVSNGFYNAGEISIVTTTDEDGKFGIEYKDKEGRIVLKKVYMYDNHQPQTAHNGYACTYYVYDDMQRLRYMIPPMAVEQHTESGNTWSISAAVADGLCYSYLYDARGRRVEKKTPGKEVEYYIYDKRDRLVLYQDGNLRAKQNWTFHTYDALDRELSSGLMVGSLGRGQTADYIDNNTTWPNTDLLYYLKTYDLYQVYPPENLAGCILLRYTYYDEYGKLSGFNFDAGQFTGQVPVGDPKIVYPKIASTTKGSVTGTMQKIITSDNSVGDWLTTVNYYDDKGRLLQSQAQNSKGGLDISSNIYYFQGALWRNILRHEQPNAKPVAGATDGAHTQIKLITTSDRNMGSNGGTQLIQITQQIDGGIEYTLAGYSYDHMGRLVTKQTPAGNTLQEYNVRGFLNHIDVANANNDPDSTHLFEENLYYDQGFGNRLFNGNIAGITWRKAGNNAPVEAYGYSYDNLNRLSHAEYRQKNTLNQWSHAAYDYTASGIDYDANGNILHMNQRGIDPPGINTPIDMDQLTYTYAPASNRLVKVQDAVAPSATMSLPDFKDNANSAQEYSYDPNGNMLTDANKGINNPITYNYLNKPSFIVLPQGEIGYYSDASGVRIQKRLKTYSTGMKDIYDYIGNFVYKNDTLQYITNSEGRARPVVNSTGQTKFVYDYFVKDHLGNVRSTVNATPIDEIYLARHEIALAGIEQMVFDNIPAVRDSKPGSNDPEDRMAAKLNGSDKKVGTAIMLKTMPGDRFIVKSDAFYEGGFKPNGDSGPEAMVESLMSALLGGNTYAGVPIAELPENVRIVKNALSNPSLIGQLNKLSANDDPERPKAHLNVLFFDKKLQLVERGSSVTQVPSGGINGWNTFGPIPEFNGPPDIGVVSNGEGYVLVYVDNQSIGKDVWFDNIMIEHYTGKILEEDHYYPHGLAVNIDRDLNHKDQPFKYNGKELEKHFGLEMYDYGARMQDPQLGVWHAIDPMAEKFPYESPFVYAGNNPVRNIDLGGNLKLTYDAAELRRLGVAQSDLNTFRTIVANVGNMLHDNPQALDVMSKTTGLSPGTILNDLKPGNGPDVNLTEYLPGARGGKSGIVIDSKMVTYLSKVPVGSDEYNNQLLGLGTTLLHEYDHYGDQTTNGGNTGNFNVSTTTDAKGNTKTERKVAKDSKEAGTQYYKTSLTGERGHDVDVYGFGVNVTSRRENGKFDITPAANNKYPTLNQTNVPQIPTEIPSNVKNNNISHTLGLD